MRIVDRKAFLTMPSGTLFAKFEPHSFGELEIKGDTIGSDFVVQSLVPTFEGCDDSGAYFDIIERMMAGEESPPVDYDCGGRDGLFDEDQLFAVWNRDDARRLLAMLKREIGDE